ADRDVANAERRPAAPRAGASSRQRRCCDRSPSRHAQGRRGQTHTGGAQLNAQTEHADERQDAAAPLSPGRRLGDFLLTRVVGQGGFGIVYEAEDLSLQRRVAIKEYMPSQLATRIDDERVHPISSRYAKSFALGRRSFVGEARLLAQFRHPGLLEVLHFWEQNGTAYMVMPFYEGMT